MSIRPILSEKSLAEAKRGNFTFWISKNMTKSQVKDGIGKLFDVHVTKVRTANLGARKKRNLRGHFVRIPAKKKAIVALREGEKIGIFEEGTKK